MKISEIKADARQKLTGKWGRAAFIVLGFVIFQLALSFAGAMPLVGLVVGIGSIVIGVPINYGLEKSFFDFYHGAEVSLFDFVGSGFKNFSKSWSVAWNKFLALLIPIIITVVSGAVLFAVFFIFFFTLLNPYSSTAAIPVEESSAFIGITAIAAIVYTVSSIFTALLSLKYMLARLVSIDNPELTGKECVAESAKLMKGNILKYIFLNLSFIGWAFLTIFTFGIGMFWLAPYMQISIVAFYRSLKPKDNSILYEVDYIVNK